MIAAYRSIRAVNRLGWLAWPAWIGIVLAALLAGCAGQPGAPLPPEGTPAVSSPTAATADVQAPVAPPEATTLPETTSLPTPVVATASQPPAQEDTPAPIEGSGALPQPPEGRTRYRLEASLDYAAHTLAVTEQITYTNRTDEPLALIQLVVDAARSPGVFNLQAIYDRDGKRIFQYHLQEALLSVRLPQELAPGETTGFSLAYTLKPVNTDTLPRLRPYPLGYTNMQANFGDWYPYIPPYQAGAGWVVHEPALFGEHQVFEIAGFEVAIRLEGRQTDLVIAASAPALQDGEWLRFEHPLGRSFAWSASPHYEVLTQTVQLGDGGQALAASYYLPLQVEGGKSLLEALSQALPLYTRLFGGPAPAYLAGVQADFIDGMEYDGLFFLSTDYYNWHKPGSQEDFLIALAAHEAAHQWWYGLVGNDQALDPWLDEALCTYSERLFFEAVYPQALGWWWTWRVEYYDPQGWVDMSIYEAPQALKSWRDYRDPVYLRGAQMLEEIRQQMGDEAFFLALRAYLQRYAYDQAATTGLLEELRGHSEQNLEEVLAEYLERVDG